MLNSPLVRKLIALALEEDLSYGDVTSETLIPAHSKGSASIVSREACVVCGLPLIEQIVKGMRASIEVSVKRKEGESVAAETTVALLKGTHRELLAAERTILNFLQRLCGVATFTQRMVEAAAPITVLDTRKTMPGWRVLDKYAVKTGGGRNHRFHLGDMILVKNNHIDSDPRGVVGVLQRLRERAAPYVPIEVEVRNQRELKAALDFNPAVVMLDNMKNDEIREALRLVRKTSPHTKVEISGGINEARLRQLASFGEVYVSMGALTTQARNVDISMRVSKVSRR